MLSLLRRLFSRRMFDGPQPTVLLSSSPIVNPRALAKAMSSIDRQRAEHARKQNELRSSSNKTTCPHCKGTGLDILRLSTIDVNEDKDATCEHCGGLGETLTSKQH